MNGEKLGDEDRDDDITTDETLKSEIDQTKEEIERLKEENSYLEKTNSELSSFKDFYLSFSEKLKKELVEQKKKESNFAIKSEKKIYQVTEFLATFFSQYKSLKKRKDEILLIQDEKEIKRQLIFFIDSIEDSVSRLEEYTKGQGNLIREIIPNLGESIDLKLHQIESKVIDDKAKNLTIREVIQEGYLFIGEEGRDRVILKAIVSINIQSEKKIEDGNDS